tara:strand:+ start:346 stop:492 length:147 start_codon:yes stop_codon:yes gene_type:complete
MDNWRKNEEMSVWKEEEKEKRKMAEYVKSFLYLVGSVALIGIIIYFFY